MELVNRHAKQSRKWIIAFSIERYGTDVDCVCFLFILEKQKKKKTNSHRCKTISESVKIFSLVSIVRHCLAVSANQTVFRVWGWRTLRRLHHFKNKKFVSAAAPRQSRTATRELSACTHHTSVRSMLRRWNDTYTLDQRHSHSCQMLFFVGGTVTRITTKAMKS